MTRYLDASKVPQDTRLRLSKLGFCNWCGKPITGRSKYFCAPFQKVIYSDYTRKDYWCTYGFMRWWLAVPRFKRAIYIRDNFTCQNCGIKPMTTNEHGIDIPDLNLLAIDHIHPYAKGGKTELDNLQVLCRKCNSQKRDMLPSTFGEINSQSVLDLKDKELTNKL